MFLVSLLIISSQTSSLTSFFELLFHIVHPRLSLQLSFISYCPYLCFLVLFSTRFPHFIFQLFYFFFSSIMILNFREILSSYLWSCQFYVTLLSWFCGFTVLSPVGFGVFWKKFLLCFLYYFLSEFLLLVVVSCLSY